MRFIGSKVQLLEEIENFIKENIKIRKNMVFCDLFSGSTAVAKYFKRDFKIISNDIMNFSYILQKSTIKLNQVPDFIKLKKYLNVETLSEILEYFENTEILKLLEKFKIEESELFIYKNYTPNENSVRMYLSSKNGKRIDVIRITLNKLFEENIIKEEEFTYLLACLIEAVPYISNISGVYGAYLKHWDKRALNSFKFIQLDVEDNNKKNECYNKNAHELITEIQGDILYLDPPYNNRQYLPNYHLLETISKYDSPKIKGITGVRDYKNEISKFCRKKEAREALEQIIKEAKFNYIIMSYSTDGILKIEEIKEIFEKYGKKNTFKMADPIAYRKYKSKQEHKKQELHELLFFIEKENIFREDLKKDSYLKCPFNYIGGKSKLMPQLMKNFPNKINTVIDLFGGGFNVGINIKADKIIYNDQITPLVELFRYFKNNTIENIIAYIEETIIKFDIKKDSKDGFLKFREKYNSSPEKHPLDLYILVCFSFNYQIRYNNSGEFNCPHGTNRSSFSKVLKQRLIEFVNEIKKKDIDFENNNFLNFDFTSLDSDSFVYCDPPYLITTGSYNDGNRGFKNWTEIEEEKLLELLDSLNARNIKFALSNVIVHEGKENKILLKWIKNRTYKVIDIDSNYSNSNYQKSKKDKLETKEVLIINY
ncbi:MAG: Dam family site-specific DNA-(adenine-N6)-methyltransferase [Cetobacterium sp.]